MQKVKFRDTGREVDVGELMRQIKEAGMVNPENWGFDPAKDIHWYENDAPENYPKGIAYWEEIYKGDSRPIYAIKTAVGVRMMGM